VAAEAASAFRGLIESGEVGRLRSAADRIGGYAMMMTLAVDYLDAQRARRRMGVALAECLGPYDAVVSPMRLSVAPPLGADFTRLVSTEQGPGPPSLIAAGSLTGLPALCVPNGLGASGLPTSLQFLGAAHSDARLLALGKAFQDASDFHKRRPPEVALPQRASATQPNP
jgi:Asp-tRNA(Asn)/Glu-tRNA(Gln) amidotransferase A subunit family amidase